MLFSEGGKAVAKTTEAPKPVKTKDSGAPGKAREKALKAKKAVLRGVRDKRSRKVRTSVHFRRPKTLRLPRAPKYPRKSTPKRPRWGPIRPENTNNGKMSVTAV